MTVDTTPLLIWKRSCTIIVQVWYKCDTSVTTCLPSKTASFFFLSLSLSLYLSVLLDIFAEMCALKGLLTKVSEWVCSTTCFENRVPPTDPFDSSWSLPRDVFHHGRVWRHSSRVDWTDPFHHRYFQENRSFQWHHKSLQNIECCTMVDFCQEDVDG